MVIYISVSSSRRVHATSPSNIIDLPRWRQREKGGELERGVGGRGREGERGEKEAGRKRVRVKESYMYM